jgi:hypothetical protein
MAKITALNQTAPTTPSSGYSAIWIDSTTKKLNQTDDGGTHRGGTLSTNHATAQQTGFAADTYLTGSNITIPSYGMQVGQLYQWVVGIEKTGAGTGAITTTVRIGTGASTSDTSRAALVQTVAQTATASVTVVNIYVFVRTVSASGVLVAYMDIGGNSGSTTGWGDGDRIVSATFDNSALGGTYIGLSLNGNTSASYTIDMVKGWLIA